MTNVPTVAAIVVAHNGGYALRTCIESLRTQSVEGLEIIVVDNASTDGSIGALEVAHGTGVHIIRRGTNGGYAAGANQGWRAARAELVVVLNQDLYLTPDCLEQMRRALLSCDRDALVTPKLVLESDPSRVNAIGLEVHLSGVAWCQGLGTPADYWHGVLEVTAISGAAFMARRSLLDRVGGVEEGYFMYLEDVDLSLRTRLAGGTCIAACDAVAVHDWTLALGAGRFELMERNRRAMWRRFWRRDRRMYPFLIQAELMGWLYAVIHGLGHIRAKVRAGAAPLRLTDLPKPPSADFRKVLARRHPYEMLFPRIPVVAGLGHVVDWIFASSIRIPTDGADR